MLPPNVEAAFHRLVEAFAARQPLPAGGAAGVTAIAMGVGLGLKVIRISRPDQEPIQAQARLEKLLDRLMPEFAADCAAFAGLFTAFREPRDAERRESRIADAWREATAAPVTVALRARDAAALLAECGAYVKPSVRADLDAALTLVECGRRIAERNARDNATRLEPDVSARMLAPLDRGDGA